MRNALLALPIALIASSAFAQEQRPAELSQEDADITQFRLVAGADHATGEFAGQEYETQSVSVGVGVTSGRFDASVTVPYVSTSAPEDLIVSQGGLLGTPLLASGQTETREVRRSGLGDVSVQASYALPLGDLNASVGGSVKLPTASREEGLGTGEVDLGLSANVSHRVGDLVPFAGVGYTIVGEPEGFDVRNTLAGTAGSHVLLGGSSALSLSYNYEQSRTRDIGDRQSVGVGFGTNVASNLRLGVEGSAGLTENAPDTQLGVRLGIGF